MQKDTNCKIKSWLISNDSFVKWSLLLVDFVIYYIINGTNKFKHIFRESAKKYDMNLG